MLGYTNIELEVSYMSNQQLYAVANTTGKVALLTSTNGAGDACSVAPGVITHTGGVDQDYIQIPDCSVPWWYPSHHILIQACDKSWTVSLWCNDGDGGKLYWNSSDEYSQSNPLEGSQGNSKGTILIQQQAGVLSVAWSSW